MNPFPELAYVADHTLHVERLKGEYFAEGENVVELDHCQLFEIVACHRHYHRQVEKVVFRADCGNYLLDQAEYFDCTLMDIPVDWDTGKDMDLGEDDYSDVVREELVSLIVMIVNHV